MPSRIQVRRDIAENWISENPVLALGEIGYETDFVKCKFGDGVSVWTELPMLSKPRSRRKKRQSLLASNQALR
ncbi:MAG: hypothetical protein HWD60_19615 [Defluviicoccus sp.]|nr:MAG: hypothetical protein HWD60_19615 [Defluviicoccus sp.]